MDRISSLPDETVSHILSFLSLKEAALTSVLAKRWRNLFAFSPNLSVNFKGGTSNSIIEFIDRVLAVSGNSLIDKFTLKCGYRIADPADINRWLCNVLSRGVSDLHLHLIGQLKYSLPLEVFSCKTLVKLVLAKAFDFAMVPEDASLPALKSLSLEHINFYDHHGRCAFEAFISVCPVLEELVMLDVISRDADYKNRWYCTVSCLTLQRLTIRCLYRTAPPDSRSVTIDTPSLVYFEYIGFLPPSYSVVNFDSLVEAKLCLFPVLLNRTNPTNLIKGLQNAEILHLSQQETPKAFLIFPKATPVFKNLRHLTITNEALQLLSQNSPNLETVVIEGALYYDGYRAPDSESLRVYSSCPMKALGINLFCKSIVEINQIKCFLEHLPCLELVKIRSRATDQDKYMQFTKNILNLPRSSKCKIEFIPSFTT